MIDRDHSENMDNRRRQLLQAGLGAATLGLTSVPKPEILGVGRLNFLSAGHACAFDGVVQ